MVFALKEAEKPTLYIQRLAFPFSACLIDLWRYIVGHQSSVEPNLLCLCVYVQVHPCICTGVCVSVQDKSLTQTHRAMNHCAAMLRI